MDPSMVMNNGTETPVAEMALGSLPPHYVIFLTHAPLEKQEGGALPQTVPGVSWKLEGCLVWKGKNKLDSHPGCYLAASQEGGGMRKVEQEDNSDCDHESNIEVRGDVDTPLLDPSGARTATYKAINIHTHPHGILCQNLPTVRANNHMYLTVRLKQMRGTDTACLPHKWFPPHVR
jgi:hypothetical protein